MGTDHDEIVAMVRDDLKSFLILVFEILNPGQTFKDNWHIDAICHQLALCFLGKTKRLIITLPPRHLKSLCSSIAFVTWVLGKRPHAHIVCASYSEDLAITFANERRKVMQSDRYKRAFPKVKIGKGKNTETETVFTQGGRIVSTSVGGTFTGKGGNFVIIDDPLKTGDAMSEAERKKVNDWFRNTVYTRHNDPKNDVFIIVMQRVHMDDLVGHMMDLDEWVVLDLPAIAQEDQEIEIDDGVFYHRKAGDVLHPDHCDLEELEKLKKVLGSTAFSAQYLQRPVPPGGIVFKKDWFQTYIVPVCESKIERVWQSWDTASQVGDGNSYSVCVTFGIQGSLLCVLDVTWGRWEYPDLKKKVVELAKKEGAERIIIEKASTGLSLLQDLMGKENLNLIPYPPKGDKLTRAEQVAAMVEAGRVYLPDDAPWLAEFLNQLLAFPGAKHDDMVDAFSQLLWYFDHHPRDAEVNFYPIGGRRRLVDYDE